MLRGRFAKSLAILATIASHGGSNALKLVGRTSGVCLSYTESIAVRLRGGGFIKGKRGHHGGYTLVNGSREMPMVQVICCLEGVEGDEDLPAEIAALLSFLEEITLDQYLDRLWAIRAHRDQAKKVA